ncbi:MAG: nucleoside triphosphate pyrophosphohydrolase [Synergistaceae bacterium]|jgi:MazG family protein|nr:nucleoside triphosphate pyrophosphohydrolase [Synergistaceae bacterium]
MDNRIEEKKSPGAAFEELVGIMRRLRGEGGCPWDAEQTLESLRRYILEEANELTEAIGEGDPRGIGEECGDLLLQVVFAAQIASESGLFDIEDVCRIICGKLVRRHPHVFGDVTVRGSSDVSRNWERIKAEERRGRNDDSSAMAGIPRGLPALLRALRIGERAAKKGFDWEFGDAESVRGKVLEELGEFREEVERNSPDAMREEFGDLLFALVNMSRHLGIDPECALQEANAKFASRFRVMESLASGKGMQMEDMPLDGLESLWQSAKKIEMDKCSAKPEGGN